MLWPGVALNAVASRNLHARVVRSACWRVLFSNSRISSVAELEERARQADAGRTGCQDLWVPMYLCVGQQQARRATVPADQPTSRGRARVYLMVASRSGAGPAVVLAALLLLPGCSSSGVKAQGPVSPGPTTSAPTATPSRPADTPVGASPATPSQSAEEAAILAQYRAFFHALTPASTLGEDARLNLMRTLAVDPELRRVMGGMAASDAAGEVGYGETVVRPKLSAAVDGDTANLTDCQDGSQSGRMKAATGVKTTVGTSHDFAKVSMKRGPDGTWRVATVEYQSEASCVASS